MKSSEIHFESAIVKIFRDQQLSKEGDRLSVSTISQAWAKAGLETSDLFNTLASMFECGLLKAIPVSESVIFALTAESARCVANDPRRLAVVAPVVSGLFRSPVSQRRTVSANGAHAQPRVAGAIA